VWEVVQALRAIEQSLQVEAKKFTGRDALVCVHGNRFIQWAVLKAIGMKPGDLYASVASSIPGAVQTIVGRGIAAVKTTYADSYPASLFKNLGKCKVLALKISP